MNESILVELGLSMNEAKVYLSLLNLGITTTTAIAKDCCLHRSNVYDSIEKLIVKGLVSYVKKDNVTLYEANDPQCLMSILSEKENQLKSILPQLMLSKKLAKAKGEAHIFEGVTAFMDILYGFLDYGEPILAYGIPKAAPEMLKTKIPHFHDKRIKKKVVMKHIYNHNAQQRIAYLNKIEGCYARYLPASFDSQVSTNICGDQVVLALWSNPVIVIQIKNQQIADSYKNYFELLWNSAKS